MAAVLGMSFEYLDALPAAEVPLYGVAALDREATELRRQCDLFLLPAEAIGGGKMETLKRLNAEMCRMTGTDVEAHNLFAELDRKYLHDLAAAQAAGNTDLVAHLEAAYALEAKAMRRQHSEAEGERQQEVRSSIDPKLLTAVKKYLGAKKADATAN